MRTLKWLICAVALLVAALLFVLDKRTQPMPVPPRDAGGASGLSTNGRSRGTEHPGNGVPATAAEPTPPGDEAHRAEEKLRAAMEGKNRPIDFWGKVVDQNDAPLSGVRIESRIRRWDFTAGSGVSSGTVDNETITGGDGGFYIGGASGDDLEIKALLKAGYELEPNAKLGFGYGTAEQIASRPEAPVVFKMWREDIKESLITGEKSFPIEPDGRTYVIDLFGGAIPEHGGGDLKVWVKRPAQVSLGQRFDWSCGLQVVNGGLLLETNAASSMYSAPPDGYASSFQWERRASESGWSDSTGSQRFYLALRGGALYGRVAVEQFAYYNSQVPSRVRIRYALNPSGSRILR